MAEVIELNDMRQGYIDLLVYVAATGDEVSPRDQATRELTDVTLVFDPGFHEDSLPVGIGRWCEPAIGAAEAIQLIAGEGNAELVLGITPSMQQYTDGGRFWGSYGDRIGEQMINVFNKLRADQYTRQAQVTLWDQSRDNVPGKHDYPCTLALSYRLRNGALEAHTTMRSNDVWLGLAYDAFQFSQLQLTLATWLGVPAGQYVHHVVSLHIYEQHIDKVYTLKVQPDKRMALPGGLSRPGDNPRQTRSRARRLMAGELPDDATFAENWYHRALT